MYDPYRETRFNAPAKSDEEKEEGKDSAVCGFVGLVIVDVVWDQTGHRKEHGACLSTCAPMKSN